MLSADFCAKLKKFVEAGGNLILEYPVAVRDENTWLALDRPTYGIAELSGFREKIRWAPVKETAEIENIKLVPQWWYIWGEIAEDAEIIGTWDTGKAAAIRRKAGTGTVTTLLASPSLAFAAGHEEAAIQITGKILNNIFPDQLLPKGLEIRTRESADHKITLIFNTNSATWVNFPTPAGTIWDQSGATIENNGTVKLSPHGFAIFGE